MSVPERDPIFDLLPAAKDAPELHKAINKLIRQRDDFKEWNYSEVRCEAQELYRAVYAIVLAAENDCSLARASAQDAYRFAFEDLTPSKI